MADTPILRMAPSPTGQLHVGTARTALFNFLYARHLGGTFLMRIEDTDVSRSTRAHAETFCEMLNWMGIDWDGEIIFQSDRFEMYTNAVNSLIEKGLAYECYETPEELEEINRERTANKLPPGYDGRAKNLTDTQKDQYRAQGRPRTVRFATPNAGVSEFVDAIRGTVSVKWDSISDFIIERADGTPTFFLANAVDDIDMGITHVVRGDDLIDSTHRVLALRRALGNEKQPFYAHTPMILAPDRSKLSKRHGAVSLESYKDQGYLPEAMVNYLALLGWAPSSGQELFSLDDMIKEFDIHDVNHAGAIFDVKKLEWMNGEYIRAIDSTELKNRLRSDAESKYGSTFNQELFGRAVELAQPRATTLISILEQMDCLFTDKIEIGTELVKTLQSFENVTEIFDAVEKHLLTCEWNLESIDLRGTVNEIGLKPRKALPAIYIAIQASTTGLPLFDVLEMIGREEAVARIKAARAILDS